MATKYSNRKRAAEILASEKPPLCACGCGKPVELGQRGTHWNKCIFHHVPIKETGKLREKLLKLEKEGEAPWNKGLTTKTDKRIRKYGRKIAVTYQDKTRTPAWRGGISYEPYSLDFTPSIKRIVKERDEFRCALCGKLENGRGHYDKKNSCISNLIILCQACHAKTNTNRGYWTNVFLGLSQAAFPFAPKDKLPTLPRRI